MDSIKLEKSPVKKSFSEGLQWVKHIDYNVKKQSYAMIVIMVMVMIGMDNIQNQISDRSSEQSTTSGAQTLSAQIQNFINKDLAAVTKTKNGLDWTKSGNVSNLQSFMKNVYSMFYSSTSGNSDETWGDLTLFLPDGSSIPLMENTGTKAAPKWQINGALSKFFQDMRSWLSPSLGDGPINWPDVHSLLAQSGKRNPQVLAPRLPSDHYSSTDSGEEAGRSELSKMKVPMIFLLAFKKLQTLVDTDYDLTASGVTGSSLESLFGSFSSDAGLQGLQTLFNDMNKNSSETPWKGYTSNYNFLQTIQFYVRANNKDPMRWLWFSPGNTPPLPSTGTKGDAIATYATTAMEATFNTWGIQHYANKNPASGSGPITPQSPLDLFSTDAGQAQTYLQSATQSNTAQIQQDIQTNESYDKVGQTIVSSVSKSTQSMVSNQKAS
ncbi:MAG: hypothetical protein S4CHLAM107_11860 [Chlamydiia bacterium]|nr:hypothetical protein [Chlamydiia bacterium]